MEQIKDGTSPAKWQDRMSKRTIPFENTAVAECKYMDHKPTHPGKLSAACREKMLEAKQFIDASYAEHITITSLAKQVGTNEHALKVGFKALFGVTIFKYRQYLRMDYALSLLKDQCMSVKEVAYLTGYSNTANFTNAFKLWYGHAPSKLKAKHVIKPFLQTNYENTFCKQTAYDQSFLSYGSVGGSGDHRNSGITGHSQSNAFDHPSKKHGS